MYEERVDKNNERGLACDGLTPFSIGDYVETQSGICGLITGNRWIVGTDGMWRHGYRVMSIEDGEVYHNSIGEGGLRRHLTVNEITALKLLGLV